ncbi:MAG: hypothetical protein ABI479_00495 [Gallionella sp.]
MSMKTMDSEITKNAAANEKHMDDLRFVVADSDTPLIEITRQAEKVSDKFVHDNRWNWH